MRSTYGGQGGHNAILLVGDFFSDALHTGKIDAGALFTGGKCAPTPVRAEAPPEDWDDQLNDTPQDEVPGADRMIRRDTDAGSVSGDQPEVNMSGQQGGRGSAWPDEPLLQEPGNAAPLARP